MRVGPTARWFFLRGLSPNSIAGFTASSGLIFYGQVREAHLRYIAKYGGHDLPVTAWMKHYLSSRQEKGIVVDIGANIGWHSLHASRIQSVEKVIACEPDLFNAHLLQKNITANKIENVVIAPWAIGNSARFSQFFLYDPKQRGRHSLKLDYGSGTSVVPVRGLDDTLSMAGLNRSRILLVKMDVLGSDLEVIQAGKETFSRCPVVVTDLTDRLMRAGGYGVGDLYDHFNGFGLSPFLVNDTELQPVSREWLESPRKRMHVIWMRNSGAGEFVRE